MRYLLLFSLSGLAALPAKNPIDNSSKTVQANNYTTEKKAVDLSMVNFNFDPGSGRMRAAEFKAQNYCRAEVENFDFDAKFSIISADVYFTGVNFKDVARGHLTSNSLEPVRSLMNRCGPGSLVVFDEIKVIGPDKVVRNIRAVSYLLY